MGLEELDLVLRDDLMQGDCPPREAFRREMVLAQL